MGSDQLLIPIYILAHIHTCTVVAPSVRGKMTLLSAMATLVFVRTISRLLPLLGGQVTYHGLPLLPETVHVAITRNFLTKSIPLKIHRDQLRTGWYKCFVHTGVWFVCLRIAFTSPALAKASSASISSYSKAK